MLDMKNNIKVNYNYLQWVQDDVDVVIYVRDVREMTGDCSSFRDMPKFGGPGRHVYCVDV